jgi:hypothetical protein
MRSAGISSVEKVSAAIMSLHRPTGRAGGFRKPPERGRRVTKFAIL